MSETNNNIRYTYIRDAENAERVLTIARRWNEERSKIDYGYALCRPDVDSFRKDIGRTIACGRLLTKPANVKLNEEVRVLTAVLQNILEADDSPRIVRKIAESWLNQEFVYSRILASETP